MGLKDVNVNAVLNSHAHLLSIGPGKTEDEYWAAAAFFTRAFQSELNAHCKLIEKLGGRRCNGPMTTIDCDKIVDVDHPYRIYDIVASAGIESQSAAFMDTGHVDDGDHRLLNSDGSIWTKPSVPQPNCVTITQSLIEVTTRLGRPPTQEEINHYDIRARSLGWNGDINCVPRSILNQILSEITTPNLNEVTAIVTSSGGFIPHGRTFKITLE